MAIVAGEETQMVVHPCTESFEVLLVAGQEVEQRAYVLRSLCFEPVEGSNGYVWPMSTLRGACPEPSRRVVEADLLL